MDFPSILLENAFDTYASQNRYNSRSHNFSYILFWPFNRFLPIDSKFCNFQVHFWLFCPKNQIFSFEFSKKNQNSYFCNLTKFFIHLTSSFSIDLLYTKLPGSFDFQYRFWRFLGLNYLKFNFWSLFLMTFCSKMPLRASLKPGITAENWVNLRIKNSVKWQKGKFWIKFENSNPKIRFLGKIAKSAPGNCKIWNLWAKIY